MKELSNILKVLYDSHVEFVVIGGAAMYLQGSAYVTKDVDFCYARTPENMKRLAAARYTNDRWNSGGGAVASGSD